MKILKVLHISDGELFNAGIEKFIINNLKNINHEKFCFYFLFNSKDKLGYHYQEFVKNGGKQLFLNHKLNKKSTINKVIYILKFIFLLVINKKFDVIHYHQNSWSDIFMIIAFLFGIKKRILHSHNAYLNIYNKKSFRLKTKIFLSNFFSTTKIACSKDAFFSFFGEKYLSKAESYILFNGVETSTFLDLDKKENIRKQFIIGQVGRFSEMKNQSFTVQFFRLFKNSVQDSKLHFLGEGEKLNEIKAQVNELNLTDSVTFYDSNYNIVDFLKKIDLFVFPSKIGEGFGIAALESQLSKIPTIISSYVPIEVDIGFSTRCNLNSIENWLKTAIEIYYNKIKFNLNQEKLFSFSIKNTVKNLEIIYGK
jgi:glycosyltransferase involved in cell wall biosynthesis